VQYSYLAHVRGGLSTVTRLAQTSVQVLQIEQRRHQFDCCVTRCYAERRLPVLTAAAQSSEELLVEQSSYHNKPKFGNSAFSRCNIAECAASGQCPFGPALCPLLLGPARTSTKLNCDGALCEAARSPRLSRNAQAQGFAETPHPPPETVR
jgi:hypothetical protein